jgi:hypothetical protein
MLWRDECRNRPSAVITHTDANLIATVPEAAGQVQGVCKIICIYRIDISI